MPAIKPGSLVLVTGASGFIAAHVCSVLLTNGYKVRGTVRSTEKGEYLKNLFKGVGDFEYVIVEDIANPASFDEAVQGVDGIAHTASPFHMNAKTPEELIDPAVKGTTGVLEAAQKYSHSLKRIVVTSSVAAVMSPEPKGPRHQGGPPYTFTEEDWNDYSPGVCQEKGNDAPPPDMYRASKTLAEQAAWKFVKENKTSWDLATINPPLVLGPVIHQCDSTDKLNTSVAQFWAFIEGKKTEEDLKTSTGNWIDVRDVATAHFKALTMEEAGGERFIVSAGPFNGQDIVDIIHSFPGDKIPNVPVGKPGSGPEINKQANAHSGAKTTKVLGIEYITLQTSVEDMYKSLQERFGKT